MTALALIPAFNEADLVGETVAALRSLREVSRVLVVDDGSTDGTAEVARAAGAEVLLCERNAGKGAALNYGIEALAGEAESRACPLLLLDADLGTSAAQAELLLAPVLAGEADMSIGCLPAPSRKGGFGFVKRLARDAIREHGGGFEAQAPLSGQRCLSAACLAACKPFAAGYGVEVVLTIRALQAGLRVLEVPVTMRHRATGRDLRGFLHRYRQYRDIKRTLRGL